MLCLPVALVLVYAPRFVVARAMAQQPEGYNNAEPRAQQAQLTGVGRRAAAAHANGATLDMDVRAPWQDPAGDRPESGHAYALLASAADRLVVWNYFGLNDTAPYYSADLATAMAKRSDKFVISVGMWAKEGSISASELASGLEASVSGGATAVAVTPSSMLDDDDWRALKKAWA